MNCEELQELNGFKVGDIVTAYQKGYHKIVKIERKTETFGTVELVHYQPLFSAKGTVRKAGIQVCNIGFCQHAVPHIDQLVSNLQETREKILQLQQEQ